MNKKIYIPILCFLIFTIFGCQKKTAVNQKLRTLRINCSEGSPNSLHPHIASNSHNVTICKALFECLTRVNLEGKAELAITEKIEVSPCGKKYFFKLKPTVWSNGEQVTSKHFANAWKFAINPASKRRFSKYFFFIKNAKNACEGKCSLAEVGIFTPNEKELIIELEHPVPDLLQILAYPTFSPLYEDNDIEPTVFNGPFKIGQGSDVNQQLTLVANPLYWDAKTVRLNKIEISFITDQSTANTMYAKGELDWIGSPLSEISDDAIQDNPKLKIFEAFEPFWLYCNTENPKLKSVKLRKALSLAIDREQIEKHVLAHQKPSYTILPKGMSQIKVKYIPMDIAIENAKKLLQEALEEIGIPLEKFQLTLSYISSQRHEKLAAYLKDNWEKNLGFKIFLKKTECASFFSQIRSGNYEIGGFCNILPYEDSVFLLNLFEKKQSNISNWESSEFQKNMFLAKQTVSIEKRNQYLKKAEEILMEELPVIPIYNHTHVYQCRDNLKNLKAPKLAYMDFKWVYFDE